MLLYITILSALAPPFLLILLGAALKRLSVLTPAHVPLMNGLVVNVTLPALVVAGLLHAPPLSLKLALPVLALIAGEAAAAAVIFGAARFLRLPDTLFGALLLVGVFGNTGFIGYPLTLALFPKQFPAAILMDQFGMALPMYLGAAILGGRYGSGGGHGAALGRFFRSPLFWGAIIGLLLHTVSLPPAVSHTPLLAKLGTITMQCLEYLGQGTTPLVLLALGVVLRPGAALKQPLALGLACAAKLVLSPVIAYALCRLLSVTGELRAETILQAAMPSAVMASVLAGQNELEGDFAVGVVFAATVLSAVTAPLLLSLLH